MANQITGRVFSIGQTQSIQTKSGNPFTKREIVLDASKYDIYTGEKGFENYPMFEFTGEKCKDLDGYQEGQVVTVSFELQGGFYKGQDGIEKNITRARAFKIEARGAAHQLSASKQPTVAQPQPQAYQAPTTRDVPPPPSNDGLPW